MAYQKRGLWLPLIKVEAQEVTRSQRKVCDVCGNEPIRRRLHIKLGSGRSQKVMVLCIACGRVWVARRMVEANNLLVYLQDGSGCVRLQAEKGDPSFREEKEYDEGNQRCD